MIISWLNYARSDIDQIQGDVFCSVTFSVSKSYGRTFTPICVDTCIPECHCIRHRFCILRRFVRNRIEIQTGIQTFACSSEDIRPSMRLKILLRDKITPIPTPLPISIRVNLVNKALVQIQRHRLLRHRPRGAQAQQAAKQQHHPFLHVFFLLLLRCPAAWPVHDALCLIIPYPTPDFQGTDAIFEAQTAFSIANLLLNPKNREKALPLRPAK